MDEPPVLYILPEHLTAQDFALLGQASRAVDRFYQLDIEHVYESLLQAEMHLWRLSPPHEGVLLMQVIESNGVKRLVLLAVAGSGIAVLAPTLGNLLVRTAAEWDCDAVETLVVDPRLARAIMRAGAKPEAVLLTMKVGGPNGRQDEADSNVAAELDADERATELGSAGPDGYGEQGNGAS